MRTRRRSYAPSSPCGRRWSAGRRRRRMPSKPVGMSTTRPRPGSGAAAGRRWRRGSGPILGPRGVRCVMNVDELFEELQTLNVPKWRYLLFRSSGGQPYGDGDVTTVILQPVDDQWEVGIADRASYDPEARFDTEDEACRFALHKLTYNPPPPLVRHLTPEEETESRRIGQAQVDRYLQELLERGFRL